MLGIRTILHPTDFSDSSQAAFRLACGFACDYRARLIVLHVYPAATAIEWPDDSREEDYEAALWPQLHDLKPDDPNVIVDYRLVEGSPVDVILEVADKEACDLVVMGTHGRSGLTRVVLGSVAEEVTRRAKCPVATVRPTVAAPESQPDAAVTESRKIICPEDSADPIIDAIIAAGNVSLMGTLQWMGQPRGVVIFAHGSGSSRFSPRNRYVAGELVQAGFAALLVDLLTEDESAERTNVFDIDLLASRLVAAAAWVAQRQETAGLPVGLFGASTGSAAAMIAAAEHSDRIAAVVSRGGRPDLAWDYLPDVHSPALLIVGGDDEPVLTWNREALDRLNCTKRLDVIPGATHLFEEPGTLEQVAEKARNWFDRYLPAASELENGYVGMNQDAGSK